MKKTLAFLVILIIASTATLVNVTYANHRADVAWIKEKPNPGYAPHPGGPNEYFWNGITAKWINFTVKNNGPDTIKEIKIVFEKGSDENALFNFSQTGQNLTGWYAVPNEFGSNKRPTVLSFHTDKEEQNLKAGMTGEFDLYLTAGPGECRHNIDVWTVDAGSASGTNFYELFIIVDTHKPDSARFASPKDGVIFQKGEMVWINVSDASDKEGPHLSDIKAVLAEVAYDPPDRQPVNITLQYDSSKKVWYWGGTNSYFENEHWHNITAIPVDYAENSNRSQRIAFFWYNPIPTGTKNMTAYTTDSCFLKNKPVGHVGASATIDFNIGTGFLPNKNVTVTFDGIQLNFTRPLTTNKYGKLLESRDFTVPEVPRGTYRINVTDGKRWNATEFTVIPWVWIDNASTREGFAGDRVTINGSGFGARVNVSVFFRDVSFGTVYNDSMALEWSKEFKFEWKPYLGNLTVGSASTDSKGKFNLSFTIPESYGGWHPVFAKEIASGVRSGWMPQYPQSAFFKVKTRIWTDSTVGLSGQFINLYASGLPLPIYTNKTLYCATNQTKTDDHKWGLVIDFGSSKRWVLEKGFILNNEFDYGWASKMYLPFAYYQSVDDKSSPVWNGTLYWRDAEDQYHYGSQFLKIPALAAGNYSISVYQVDLTTAIDDTQYKATIMNFTVLKDPLHLKVSTGSQNFAQEKVNIYIEIDVDGMATDPTELTIDLYCGETFIQPLTASRIGTGLYSTSFSPQTAGTYFLKVKAIKNYQTFTLEGFDIASFTVDGVRTAVTLDLDGDGIIDVYDVSMVARAYDSKPGQSRWNDVADIDRNLVVNIVDMVKVAQALRAA